MKRYWYRVLPHEVDLTLKITLQTIGDYVLHTAGEDADRFGFGVDALQSKHMTWVISRMAIEMMRYPVQHERYSIETWVEDVNRLMTTRNFIIRDESGEMIGAASTCWAMIDFGTRRPLDLSQNLDYANAITPLPCPIERPARIGAMQGEEVARRTVCYSDVDFNRHANSMKYLQWMIDALPLGLLVERTLNRVDINFVHETMYGDELVLFAEKGEQRCHFEIRKAEQAACKAIVHWK